MKREGLPMIALLVLLVAALSCGEPQPTAVVEEIAPTPAIIEEAPTATLPVEEAPTAMVPVGEAPTATPMPAAPLAALVNGEPITLAEYQSLLDQFETSFKEQGLGTEGEEALAALRRQVLEQMINQKLIEQAAAREGISVSEEEVTAQIEEGKREMGGEEKFNEWLQANGMTYEDLRAMLRSQLLGNAVRDRVIASVPAAAEQVHARHILVATEERAQEVLAQLQTGGDFAALARQYSEDLTTKDNGGDLGFFPRGMMPPEFEEAAFALSPGQVSGVVQTYFGFHVIQVLEKDASREVPTEMLQALRQQAFMDWLEEQRAKATIERFVE